jgi:hypothetical protein
MTKPRLFGCAVFAAAIAWPASAVANPPATACSVVVQQLGDAHIAPYNALSGADYSDPIRLRLSNRGDAPCSGTVTIRNSFGDPALVQAGGGKLTYAIVDEHDRSMVVFDPVTNDGQPIPVEVPAKDSIEIQPRFVVPNGQAGRAGRYGTILEARFRQDGTVDDELGDVSLDVNVQPSAQANFVGYGADATLDLGELTPGKSGSIGLQVRASADIDVQVTSEAHGKLVQTTGAGIPYALTVNGAPVDLSTAKTINVPIADSVHGQTMPVEVLVGDFHNAPVGHYRDVITFQISAK